MRGFLHGFPRQRRVWVEVENKAVGFVELFVGGVPGMQFKHVHLYRTEQGVRTIDDHRRLTGLVLVVGDDMRNTQTSGVFLKEQFTAQTVRCSNQGHRALLEVWQHPRRYRGVVLGDLPFGCTACGVDQAVWMGQTQFAQVVGQGNGCVRHGALQVDRRRWLVIA
ncbi:hypothetical protein D3C78_738910 [compost metagenome]